MAQTRVDTNLDPVGLAAELRPLLARNAARAERDRRLPAENVEALQAANLFEVIAPRRWGGYGAPLPTTLGTFAELAKGCPSSGWVTMIINTSTWWASLLPDRGQEEIFANPADSRVCNAGMPAPVVRRMDGGVRISGKFPFASGCWHSSWGSVTGQIEDDTHKVVDRVILFAPISEFEIEDTWFVAGMCGTGSNTLVAKDLFVPDHRALSITKIVKGESSAQRHSGEPSDRYAIVPATAVIALSPVIGIAQAMLEKVIEGTRTRGITATIYTRQADAAVVQHQIAEAALKIDSAWLQVMRAAAEVEDSARTGSQMDYVARARVRGVVGYAARLIREALDALMSIGGASGFADSSPLQRMWRDASIATRHALLATDPNLEIYGRALVGAEGNITPLI